MMMESLKRGPLAYYLLTYQVYAMLSHLKIKVNIVPQSSHPPSLPVEIVTVITILLVVTLLKICVIVIVTRC